jgi:class 3 adenylate cyclase
MKDLHWTWRWVLDVPPAALWPIVADTDAFNRHVGLPPLEYRPLPDDGGVPRREARMRRRGLTIVWEEYPFEFEEPRRFSVLRRYRTGPVAEMHAALELEPHPQGTELVYRVRARPRFALAALPIRIEIGLNAYRSFARAFRNIERAVRRHEEPYPEPPALEPALRTRLARALDGVPNSERLLDYLFTASDADLFAIRPFRLASRLGLDCDSALTTCVQATRAGVLEGAWTVLCPHCRGAKAESGTLADLEFSSHCDACSIDFQADFDRLTELRFRLSPRWKRLTVGEYCIGGPGLTPHIAVQFCVPAGGTVSRTLVLEKGTYRVRSTASPAPLLIEVAGDGADAAAVTLTETAIGGGDLRLRSACRVHVENRVQQDAVVSIERTEWADAACSPAYVSARQQHRDLFDKDVLAPGVAVKVGSMAILFTDLKDSTAMYGRIGDARAFGVVRKHFDVLYDAARRHRGAVVKTIGDAVMACFLDPADAVDAALDMQQHIAGLRSADGEPLVLKIGLHAGPCFAVTMNGVLDYFGSTVNLAARVHAHSDGNDVVFAQALADTPDIRARIAAFPADQLDVPLKGFDAAGTRLVRVRVGPS